MRWACVRGLPCSPGLMLKCHCMSRDTAAHHNSRRLSVCYLYVFPVSSSVHRWLTGAFRLRAGTTASLAATYVVLPRRWSRGLEGRRCCVGLPGSRFSLEVLLLGWVFFLTTAWRCLFVRVLDTFNIQVAPSGLLRLFFFLVEHTERVICWGRSDFSTLRFLEQWAIPIVHHALLGLLFKRVPLHFKLSLDFLNWDQRAWSVSSKGQSDFCVVWAAVWYAIAEGSYASVNHLLNLHWYHYLIFIDFAVCGASKSKLEPSALFLDWVKRVSEIESTLLSAILESRRRFRPIILVVVPASSKFLETPKRHRLLSLHEFRLFGALRLLLFVVYKVGAGGIAAAAHRRCPVIRQVHGRACSNCRRFVWRLWRWHYILFN